MKVRIKTSTGVDAIITTYTGSEAIVHGQAVLEIDGKKTSDFAFIEPNAAELVEHFLVSEDVDFAVGITGADAITKAVKQEQSNMGHSLMSVMFLKTNNIMPLGELSPNYVPEITSLLMASYQPKEEKQTINLVTTVTGFELLGEVVEIALIEK